MKATVSLSVREIAADLNVSESTVRREIRGDTLEAMRVRGQYRITQEAYTRYKEVCKTKPQA